MTDLAELNTKLATRSYVVGHSITDEDKKTLETLCCIPCKGKFPHAYRWAIHIIALVGIDTVKFTCCTTTSCAPGAAKKAAAADDDFEIDFGDDEEEATAQDEEDAATKARRERMAAALALKEKADANKEKKKKDKPVERSLVVLEVKPWEAECDLKAVWATIKEYKQEGLTWGEGFKLEPVAFGIMKLVMTCSIVDSLVLMDDITDHIESIEEFVQSVNIASMNKIS